MHRCQPTSRPALPTRQAPARRRQSVRRPRPVGPADHAVQIPPGCRRSAEPDPTPFRKRLRSLVNRRAQDPTGRRRARRRHRRAPLRRGQFYLTTAARPGRSSRRSAPPPGRSSRPGRKQASRPASAAGRPADVPNAACLRARPSRRTLAGAIGAWGCRGLPAAVVPAAAAQLGRPGRARAHQCGMLDGLWCDLASGGAKISASLHPGLLLRRSRATHRTSGRAGRGTAPRRTCCRRGAQASCAPRVLRSTARRWAAPGARAAARLTTARRPPSIAAARSTCRATVATRS